jgi:hypothetical protein
MTDFETGEVTCYDKITDQFINDCNAAQIDNDSYEKAEEKEDRDAKRFGLILGLSLGLGLPGLAILLVCLSSACEWAHHRKARKQQTQWKAATTHPTPASSFV